MKEIKFRAWEKEQKRWLCGEECEQRLHFNWSTIKPHDTEIMLEDKGFDWKFSDLELVFFTGLHDKNGKEIYEGDILSFVGLHDPKYKYPYRPFEVYWDKEKARFSDWSPREDVEVIGNIFENPELLDNSRPHTKG